MPSADGSSPRRLMVLPSPLLRLSLEEARLIFAHLDMHDLGNLCAVSKVLREHANACFHHHMLVLGAEYHYEELDEYQDEELEEKWKDPRLRPDFSTHSPRLQHTLLVRYLHLMHDQVNALLEEGVADSQTILTGLIESSLDDIDWVHSNEEDVWSVIDEACTRRVLRTHFWSMFTDGGVALPHIFDLICGGWQDIELDDMERASLLETALTCLGYECDTNGAYVRWTHRDATATVATEPQGALLVAAMAAHGLRAEGATWVESHLANDGCGDRADGNMRRELDFPRDGGVGDADSGDSSGSGGGNPRAPSGSGDVLARRACGAAQSPLDLRELCALLDTRRGLLRATGECLHCGRACVALALRGGQPPRSHAFVASRGRLDGAKAFARTHLTCTRHDDVLSALGRFEGLMARGIASTHECEGRRADGHAGPVCSHCAEPMAAAMAECLGR